MEAETDDENDSEDETEKPLGSQKEDSDIYEEGQKIDSSGTCSLDLECLPEDENEQSTTVINKIRSESSTSQHKRGETTKMPSQVTNYFDTGIKDGKQYKPGNQAKRENEENEHNSGRQQSLTDAIRSLGDSKKTEKGMASLLNVRNCAT